MVVAIHSSLLIMAEHAGTDYHRETVYKVKESATCNLYKYKMRTPYRNFLRTMLSKAYPKQITFT